MFLSVGNLLKEGFVASGLQLSESEQLLNSFLE